MQLQNTQLNSFARRQLSAIQEWLDAVERVDDTVLWINSPVWVLDDEVSKFVGNPGSRPIPPSSDQLLPPQPPPARGIALLARALGSDEAGFPIRHLAWGATSADLGLVRFGGGAPQPQPLVIEAAGISWPQDPQERMIHRIQLERRWTDSAPQSALIPPLLNLWYLIIESAAKAQVWEQDRPVLYLSAPK